MRESPVRIEKIAVLRAAARARRPGSFGRGQALGPGGRARGRFDGHVR